MLASLAQAGELGSPAERLRTVIAAPCALPPAQLLMATVATSLFMLAQVSQVMGVTFWCLLEMPQKQAAVALSLPAAQELQQQAVPFLYQPPMPVHPEHPGAFR